MTDLRQNTLLAELTRELQNSPAQQVARMLECRNEKLIASIQKRTLRQNTLLAELTRKLQNPTAEQTALVLLRSHEKLIASIHEKLSVSHQHTQEWAKVSASINGAQRALLDSTNFKIILKFDHELRTLALGIEHAILPTAKSLQVLSECTARLIQPFQDHFAKIDDWQSSLSRRMEKIAAPWAIEDQLRTSVIGFARIARLHDIAVGTAPFASKKSKIFEEELGLPVPFNANAEPIERENAMMDAGLNPGVIAFPTSVYPSVLSCAGFNLNLEVTGSVVSERGDNSGVFDTQYDNLFRQVELRLREFVEKELTKIASKTWYRTRVPGPTWRKWQERKEADQQQRRDSYPLIFYADFTDLSDIICRNDNWTDAFQQFFESKSDIQVSLQRLNPVRKAIAHHRPLIPGDQLILFSEARRILSALGVQHRLS